MRLHVMRCSICIGMRTRPRIQRTDGTCIHCCKPILGIQIRIGIFKPLGCHFKQGTHAMINSEVFSSDVLLRVLNNELKKELAGANSKLRETTITKQG